MLNFVLRYRMKRIISLLENRSNVLSLLQNEKYRKAFLALESDGYVRGFYIDSSNVPQHVLLEKKGYLYLLERSEIWINRIAGFICGILTSVIARHLLNVL